MNAVPRNYAADFYRVAEELGFSFSAPSVFASNVEINLILSRIAALRSQHSLPELCAALGWQGGTIHGVIAEIKRLKALDTKGKP